MSEIISSIIAGVVVFFYAGYLIFDAFTTFFFEMFQGQNLTIMSPITWMIDSYNQKDDFTKILIIGCSLVGPMVIGVQLISEKFNLNNITSDVMILMGGGIIGTLVVLGFLA